MNSARSIAEAAKASQKLPPHALAMANAARYSIPDGSTYAAQATLYQKLTWIATAVDFVANSAAVLPFSVKKLNGEDTEDIPNHDFEVKLRRPNPLQSRFEFLRDYFAYRKLTGNAYVYLNRASENEVPSELWIIPSHLIKPIPDGRSYIRGYLFEDGGTQITLQPWQVMHDKTFNPLNPFVGLSAIESLAVVARGDIAQQAYTTKLFDKDNAKIPGAFAFADMVNDGDWERMQNESKEKWGGMNRSGPMWLRGVGAGGVQWLQMALSQKDMEFIEQRQFTKEEIWSRLAPGLASVLAVNATEANALAGKAILAEYELWPTLVQASEKITKDILSAYGDNIVGEFDDPRKSDRLLDMQEQVEYSKTHTVNEIRLEYYGDEEIEGGDVPIADWHGETKTETEPPPFGQSDTTPNPMDETEATEQEPTEAPNANAEAEAQAEMKAWEHFALKRLGKQGGREFEPRAIPLWQAARIKAALKGCGTADEVREVFASEKGDGVDELKRANDLLERALKVVEQ